MGAVGFLPKLVPTALHPIALVRADEQGGLVRGPDGYCIRCQPSKCPIFNLYLGISTEEKVKNCPWSWQQASDLAYDDDYFPYVF